MWRDRLGLMIMGFWLIPGGCAVAAIGLAIVLIQVDQAVISSALPVLFPAGPDGARALLGAITSSMISFTALVFSITVIVLQLTSSQFSPRVLQTFLRDRATRVTLGVFVATFLYAMTVLRSVRGESTESVFVPRIATTTSFLLVLASVSVFIYYIHHITNAIRASHILHSVGSDTRRLIEQEYPRRREVHQPPDWPVQHTVEAWEPGVLTGVAAGPLVEQARAADCMIQLVRPVGTFLPEGAPLLAVRRDGPVPDGALDHERLRSALRFGIERTMQQDVGYGFRQLTDVAERMLSPSLNDHTTAVQSIDQAHDLLRRLVTRPMPQRVHTDADGAARLVVAERGIEDYLKVAVDQVAHWGSDSPRVLGRLRDMLTDLEPLARPEHVPPIRRRIDRLTAQLDQQ